MIWFRKNGLLSNLCHEPKGFLFTVGLALASLNFIQCQNTSEFVPHQPDQAHFLVYHLGTYSSKIDEEKEIEGTIFQTTLNYHLDKKGGEWILRRACDTLFARGYHKFSMPHELEKKVPLEISFGADFIPNKIVGYDSLKSILGRIQQKEEYRKQLIVASDPAVYSAQIRDWWRMANFLPHGQPLQAKQSLSVTELNTKLETFKTDSARFDGPRPRMKKSCLDYTLFYHRSDSLPLLVEQFYFSAFPNRKFRAFTHKLADVKGILQFSVDQKTGLPCFHSRSEMGEMIFTNKEEKTDIPVHLYRYEEDLYD